MLLTIPLLTTIARRKDTVQLKSHHKASEFLLLKFISTKNKLWTKIKARRSEQRLECKVFIKRNLKRNQRVNLDLKDTNLVKVNFKAQFQNSPNYEENQQTNKSFTELKILLLLWNIRNKERKMSLNQWFLNI